jgi:hypothetical protein
MERQKIPTTLREAYDLNYFRSPEAFTEFAKAIGPLAQSFVSEVLPTIQAAQKFANNIKLNDPRYQFLLNLTNYDFSGLGHLGLSGTLLDEVEQHASDYQELYRVFSVAIALYLNQESTIEPSPTIGPVETEAKQELIPLKELEYFVYTVTRRVVKSGNLTKYAAIICNDEHDLGYQSMKTHIPLKFRVFLLKQLDISINLEGLSRQTDIDKARFDTIVQSLWSKFREMGAEEFSKYFNSLRQDSGLFKKETEFEEWYESAEKGYAESVISALKEKLDIKRVNGHTKTFESKYDMLLIAIILNYDYDNMPLEILTLHNSMPDRFKRKLAEHYESIDGYPQRNAKVYEKAFFVLKKFLEEFQAAGNKLPQWYTQAK